MELLRPHNVEPCDTSHCACEHSWSRPLGETIYASTLSSADDLNVEEWDALITGQAGTTEQSVGFLALLEKGFGIDYTFHYTTIRDARHRLMLACPAFGATDIRLETVLPPSPYKRWLEQLRRLNARLLPHRALVVGTPWNDEYTLGALRTLPESTIATLLTELERIRRIKELDMIIFKNVTDSDFHERLFRPSGFMRIEGLPNAYVQCRVDSFDHYLAVRLDATKRRNARSKLRKAKVVGYDVEVRSRLAADTVELFRLFENTYLKSSYKFERPTAHLLRLLAESQSPDIIWLFVKRHSKVIAAACCFPDGQWLTVKRIGLDYSADFPFLYFVLHYELMTYAIVQRFEGLKLGPTSYDAKRELGAEFQRVSLFVKHENPLVQELIRIYDQTARLKWSFLK